MKNSVSFLFRQSFKYNYLQNILSKFISLIFSVFVARILFIDDFGHILIANAISSGVRVFSDIGLTNYYFQKIIRNEKQKNEILCITTFYSFIVYSFATLIQIIIGYIAIFYGNDIVGNLLFIYSAGTFLSIPISIHGVILKKDFKYKTISISRFFKDIVASFSKFFLASFGFGVFSIAIGDIIGKAVNFSILSISTKYYPSKSDFNNKYSKDVIFFGKHGLLIGIAGYISSHFDKLFFSFYFPVSQLGLINFGIQYGSLIDQTILMPQRSLINSLYISIKDNFIDLRNMVLAFYRLTIIFVSPIITILYLNAEVLVNLIFGDKWLLAVPFLRLYLINSMLASIIFSANGLLSSLGHPEIISRIKLIRLPFLITILFIAKYNEMTLFQIVSIYIISNFLLMIPQFLISIYKIELSVVAYINVLYKQIFGIIICAITVLYIRTLELFENIYLTLFTEISLFILLYILWVILCFGNKIKDDINDIFFNERS